jgi:hypothetical protein
MPVGSVGFAEVGKRLCQIRRRLNLFAVQRAVYVSGSAVSLAAGLVIVLALRSTPLAFSIGLWVLTGVVLTIVLHAALRLQRSWISLEQAAAVADGRAQLDDRLATLLAAYREARISPLRHILLGQVLALAPRWEVRAILPRHLPRSALLFLASLAALYATAWIERPPPTPTVVARAAGGAVRGQPPSPAAGSGLPVQRLGGPTGSGRAGAPHDRGQRVPAVRAGGGSSDEETGSQDSSAREGATADTRESAAGEDGARPAEGDRIAQRVQELVRRVFSAKRTAPPRVLSAAGADRRQPQARAGNAEAPGAKPPASRSQTAGMRAASTTNRGAARDSSATANRRGGAGRGGGRGAGADGLLSARPARIGGDPAAKTFTLRLIGFSRAPQMQFEPQAEPRPGIAADVAAGAPASPPPTDPNATDVEDAALRRTAISPEHERVVTRVFSVRP